MFKTIIEKLEEKIESHKAIESLPQTLLFKTLFLWIPMS